ncbi:MAG: choice-of-anchor Q domain-containing protein [Anaerolineales bacterium]
MWLRTVLILGLLLAAFGSPGSTRAVGAARVGAAAAGAPADPAGGVVGTGLGTCTEAALHTALAGGGAITFNCGGPASITVTAAQTITAATTIAGGDVITLTGGGTNRLFVVDPGASLSLQHITLTHGRVNGGAGGSIYSRGSLSLNHTRIQDSTGHANDYGGAIVAFGALHISDSTFSSNQAGFGGAIYADNFFNTARVFITNTTFNANHALTNTSFNTGNGGAIMLGQGAHLTDISGNLFGNTAQSGGAVYLMAGSVVTLSTDTTLIFSGNTAYWDGGAIYNNQGHLLVVGVELSGNTTPQDSIGLGYGGAIYSSGSLFLFSSYLAHNEGRFGGGVCACGANPISDATIQNTTLLQNTASQLGGGLYSNTDVTVQILDSSFNGNTGGSGGGLARINSPLTVWRSSFTFNHAASGGGGLLLATAPVDDHTIGGYVDVRDVTVSGNFSDGPLGGGVYNAGLAQLYSVTLKNNGTGVYTESGGETRLRASALENYEDNCQGSSPVDDGSNFASDLTCAFATSTQGAGLDAKLHPLTSDGLLKPYFHLPALGSPLINHGPASASQCKPVDQRGLLRIDRCDIGAVEFRGEPVLWLPIVQRLP